MRKKRHVIGGREFLVEGYEHMFLRDLGEFGLTPEELGPVPEVLWTDAKGKQRSYHADFFVPARDTLVEVKSAWTMSRRRRGAAVRKAHAALAAGHRLVFVVYLDGRGKRRLTFDLRPDLNMKLAELMREVVIE